MSTNENNEVKESKEKKSIAREALEWIICIVVAFALALFIKFFIFTPTLVMQNSMTPTILNEERVLINRLVRTFNLELNRGDIITFEAPTANVFGEGLSSGDVKAKYKEINGPINKFLYYVVELEKISYIKRVIALEGDKVEIKDGKLYVNGELQNEDYIPKGVPTKLPAKGGVPSSFVVPEGYIFCMGDNREGSSDCRIFGCVPKEKVEGRVVIRLWPLTKFGGIGPASNIEDYAKK